MKRCSKCKATKPESDFNAHKGTKDGLSHWCKPCDRESKRQSRRSFNRQQPVSDSMTLCECGCGQPTLLGRRNYKKKGEIKGVPMRFLYGHNRKNTQRNPKKRKARATETTQVKPQETITDRFQRKFQSSPDGGCWEWAANKDAKGYGLLAFKGKSYRAHRLSWELTNGPIPDGMLVCHKCDNPSCVNPEHLFIGTPKDNTQDSVKKGRHVMPQKSPGYMHYNLRRTHCRYGHPLSGDNLAIWGKGRRMRACRACNRKRQMEYRAKKQTRKGVDCAGVDVGEGRE